MTLFETNQAAAGQAETESVRLRMRQYTLIYDKPQPQSIARSIKCIPYCTVPIKFSQETIVNCHSVIINAIIAKCYHACKTWCEFAENNKKESVLTKIATKNRKSQKSNSWTHKNHFFIRQCILSQFNRSQFFFLTHVPSE